MPLRVISTEGLGVSSPGALDCIRSTVIDDDALELAGGVKAREILIEIGKPHIVWEHRIRRNVAQEVEISARHVAFRHLVLDGGNRRITNPYYRGSVEHRADESAAVDRDSIQHGVKRAVVGHVSSKAGRETPKLGEDSGQ